MTTKSLCIAMALMVSTIPALAQNVTSRALMAAPEAKRNAAFLMILQSTNDRCNEVVRTQYNASVGDSDDWEAKCRDGGHYSFSVYGDPNRQTLVLSCRELLAVGRMLQKRGGGSGPVPGCRIQ
jgi:hypothetical protein